MLAIPGNARIFLYKDPTDMRKGFEGLTAIIEYYMQEKPTEGGYFVFLNYRRDRMKVLYWDGDGFVIWYKRLEKGSYSRQSYTGFMDRREFLMMLEGIVPQRIQKRLKI